MGHISFLIAETEKLLFNVPDEIQLNPCCPGLCGVLESTQNREIIVPLLPKFLIFEKKHVHEALLQSFFHHQEDEFYTNTNSLINENPIAVSKQDLTRIQFCPIKATLG